MLKASDIQVGHDITLYDARKVGQKEVFRRGSDSNYLSGHVYVIEGDNLKIIRYETDRDHHIYFEITKDQIQKYVEAGLVNIYIPQLEES